MPKKYKGQALLIAGDEYEQNYHSEYIPRERFIRSIMDFGDFLRQTGIQVLRIFDGTKSDGINYWLNVMNCLKRITSQNTKNRYLPLLIAYCGHGGKDGWWFNENTLLPYLFLVQALLRYRGPILILNDCCYSWSLVEELERFRANPEMFGVISAACKDEMFSGINVISRARDYWLYGIPLEQPPHKIKTDVEYSYTEAVINNLGIGGFKRLKYQYACCPNDKNQLHLFGENNPWRRGIFDPTSESPDSHSIRKTYKLIDAEINLPRRWGARLDYLFFVQKQLILST